MKGICITHTRVSYTVHAGAQAEEIDHVVHVIELLTQARRQYKQLKSARMTRFLAVQIANEYRDAQQHERAFLYVCGCLWRSPARIGCVCSLPWLP